MYAELGADNSLDIQWVDGGSSFSANWTSLIDTELSIPEW